MSGLALCSNIVNLSETNPRFTSAQYAELSTKDDDLVGSPFHQDSTGDVELQGMTATPQKSLSADARVQENQQPAPAGRRRVQSSDCLPCSAKSPDPSTVVSHAAACNGQVEQEEETDEYNLLRSEQQQLLPGARHSSSQEEEQPPSQQRNASSKADDLDRPWYRQPIVVLCMLGGGSITLCVNYLDELAPIFASARPEEGGVNMSTSSFALPLAFGGTTLMLFSILVYPAVQKRWGRLNCCRAGLVSSACAAAILPNAHAFVNSPWLAQSFMYAAIGIRSIAKIMALSSSTIIVNSVAPLSQIGAVNGAGQTRNALARSVGPITAGVVWGKCAASNIPGKQHLPFLASLGALLCVHPVYNLPCDSCSPWNAVLCCAVLCCAVLCCAVLLSWCHK